jgi:MFS family permease
LSFLSLPPALKHRNYRLLWLGQLISISGSMMQNAAILWHVYEVENDPVALGIVGLVRILPIIGFSFISGIVADSYDRRRIMLISQTGMMICAASLGLLAFMGIDSAWPIYIIATLSSAFSAFDLPARQALTPSLVPPEDLPNAFSVGSLVYQFGSISGPALSGIVIARMGLQWAYWFDAISFVAVIAALFAMDVKTTGMRIENRPTISLASAMEGLRFVRNSPLVLSSMLLDFFATFFSSATALLPIYARDILHVGVEGYGWLSAATAVGATITALVLTFVRQIPQQGKVLVVSVLLYGVATIIFGLSNSFLITFLALAATGITDTVSTVIRNTLRQLHTPDAIRGRMVSVNMMFFMGGPQLGELEAGLVAGWVGAPLSVITGGVGCVLAVLWVARQWPQLWRYNQQPTLAQAGAVAD